MELTTRAGPGLSPMHTGFIDSHDDAEPGRQGAIRRELRHVRAAKGRRARAGGALDNQDRHQCAPDKIDMSKRRPVLAGQRGPRAADWLAGREGSLRHALALVKPAWRQPDRTFAGLVLDMGAHSACSELLQSCSVNSTPALPRSLFAAALSAQLRCDEKISTTEAVLAETTRAAPAPAFASGFICLVPRAPLPMTIVVRLSGRNAREVCGGGGAPETASVNPWQVARQARQASSAEYAERMLAP